MKNAIITLGLLLCACDSGSDEGESTLRFTAWGEDFIEQGIPAEEFVDGWSVTFETFEVTLEGVEADGTALDSSHVVDVSEPSGGEGHEIGTVVVPASGTPLASWSITSVVAVGTATKDDVTKTFDWSFDTPTRYVDCDTETPLTAGETTDVVLTIHADHLFYDDLDSEEPGVAFDLIAAADADGDGEVTMAELGQQSISGEVRYQVGSRNIEDLGGFIEAQVATLGHINGEGHCDVQ